MSIKEIKKKWNYLWRLWEYCDEYSIEKLNRLGGEYSLVCKITRQEAEELIKAKKLTTSYWNTYREWLSEKDRDIISNYYSTH